MDYAIGIDLGTTNSKVVLCKLPSCKVVHLEKFASPKIETSGNVDFDIQILKQKVLASISACAAASSGIVRFISIASVGESGVLVYADGTHDKTSIAWFDTRGKGYADKMYDDGFAEEAYRETGIPAYANYGLFKILWLRDHGVKLDGAKWLPLGDFFAWWLTGALMQDESLASRTFALNIETKAVATDILDRYGLPSNLFPPLIESGTSRGSITKDFASKTGLPETCQVCVAGHDHMAGSVACGLDPVHEVLNSTGTSEGILAINEHPVLTKRSYCNRLSNGLYVQKGLFSYYASLPTAGYALEWIANLMGINENDFFDVMPIDMHRRYLSGEFDGRELLFLPHLRGSGPPDRRTNARGCLYGIRDTTTRDDVFFSADLGLVFELNNLFIHMIQDDNKSTVKVIGPSIKSPLWMQLKADVLGVEVQACRVRESVARGAVMLAAMKAGYEIKPEFDCTTYTCNPAKHAYYTKLFEERYLPFSSTLADYEKR